MRLLGLMLLAVSGCATLGADALTRPMRVPIIGSPGLPHRELSWRTADGLTLRGWVFDPEGTPRGLVVLVHGKDINRQHFAGEAVRFTRRGWQVLAFDQRAHGASEGQRTTFGFHEVDDLKRGLDRLGATRVVLIGESLGAAVSLQTAARDPRVVGCVAGASFSDLETIAAEHRPFFFSDDVFAKARALAETEAGFRIEAISPQRDVATITTPLLLLHGTKDTFIHPDHARRLHASGPSTELIWLDGVGHIDVLVHAEAWNRIERWMDERSL
ncbi:MAG: lysophospholipase [Myxococcaceae bacterium]|jgi:pimeloyl-ACP methyl ester carboxylesterase|nr:lysophospholipase [Myxococcaceae bacterium]